MKENAIRRQKLFDMMAENSVAIIFSGVSKIATEDEYYPFKANNHFFYLTNIKQENSMLMLVKTLGENHTYLFVDEYDELKEKWTGKRLTFEEASELSNIKNVYSSKSFESMYELALVKENNQYGSINKLYVDHSPEIKIGAQESTVEFIDKIFKKFNHIDVENIYPMITRLRMVKSEYEIGEMKKAIHLTNLGLQDLIKNMKHGEYEYEIADRFEFYGRSHEQSELAFSTIIAGGKNACCLHYPSQQEKVDRNDMILCDLGYKTSGYSADITRTYPIDGVYKGDQRLIYQAVLNCNKAVIEYARSGVTIKDLQDHAVECLKNECIKAGLMTPEEDIKKYYYHNISHHLGLDTHDASLRELPLEPGNVITVEPGLYFANKGIGVRIEDDVLITDTKAVVLSSEIKKEIADIEKLLETRK